MVKDGLPIQEVARPSLGSKPPLNLGYEHEPGIVAEFECREAAQFALLSWAKFCELRWEEKAKTIAFYRLKKLIEYHQNAHALG